MGHKERVEINKTLPGQESFANLALKSYLLGAALVLAAAFAGFIMLTEMEQRSIDEDVERVKSRLNTDINVTLGRYVDRVNLLATDPYTLMLLENPLDRATRELGLAFMIGATQVLVFGQGEEKGMSGDYPNLTFSELDLVYAAEEGGLSRVEFHALTGSDAHLDIVRPLKKGDVIVGYVFARFEAAVLRSTVKAMVMNGVRLELAQLLSNGQSEVFVSWGDEKIKLAGVKASGNFEFSKWQLNVWEQPKRWLIFDIDWRLFFAMAVIAVLAALGLMLLGFLILVKKLVNDSVNVLFAYVRERLSGQWMGKEYVSALIELQPTLDHMQNLNWSALAPVVAVGAVAEKENKLSAAEATELGRKAFEDSYIDVLYQDKVSIEVEDGGEQAPELEAITPKQQPASASPEKQDKGQASNRDALEALLDISSDGIDPSIFRAYDIRGVVGEALNEDVCYEIGRAFGTEAWQVGEQTVVVGRDGRHSSADLSEALIRGLRESGRDVIDLGLVPTPLLYFATHYLSARSGLMVTGSHNPPEYNGLKLVLKGKTLSGEDIQMIYQRITSGDYASGGGSYQQQDLAADYVARISSDSTVGMLKVVLDCGHGAGSDIAPDLLRTLGCEVIELYCEVDGDFPAHHPDPSRPENLQDLIHAVIDNKADIGLALDGDGDRLGVIDSEGNIIWPDRQLMLYSLAVLAEQPGAQIIYDVKCSRHLQQLIEHNSGHALMWKSGHSLMKAKLLETGAMLAGEMSGHIFFNDRWYGFDDAMYCAARLLEIIAKDKRPSAEIFAALPDAISTPEILVYVGEGRAVKIIELLLQSLPFPGAQINSVDGIRAEFPEGWGLVRASNTTPCLMLRFEAENELALERIKMNFRQAIESVAPEVEFDF